MWAPQNWDWIGFYIFLIDIIITWETFANSQAVTEDFGLLEHDNSAKSPQDDKNVPEEKPASLSCRYHPRQVVPLQCAFDTDSSAMFGWARGPVEVYYPCWHFPARPLGRWLAGAKLAWQDLGEAMLTDWQDKTMVSMAEKMPGKLKHMGQAVSQLSLAISSYRLINRASKSLRIKSFCSMARRGSCRISWILLIKVRARLCRRDYSKSNQAFLSAGASIDEFFAPLSNGVG